MKNTVNWTSIVLAAGKGSRFTAETGQPFPKVLREANNKPLISYVLDTIKASGIEDIVLIVGYMADDVKAYLKDTVKYIYQTEQLGSGHAIKCAKETFKDIDGSVLIMCGDSPLFTIETLLKVKEAHLQNSSTITLCSSILDNPTGYGRILRDNEGNISSIVEEKCADASQKSVKEVNGGAYAFDTKWLFDNIDLMEKNETGEYNLTDMVRVAISQKLTISSVPCLQEELLGVNTPSDLKIVEGLLSSRDSLI